MPTIGEIYRALKEHEDMAKTAQTKEGIASPQRGAGQPAAEVGAVLEDVLGQNIAETKVRIKKKLEEAAGSAQAVEGLSSDANDENPATNQGPIVGDKMPPAGEASGSGVAAKMSAHLAKGQEKKAEPKAAAVKTEPAQEKDAAEKLAEEYHAAGRIMAQGFYAELNQLMGAKE
jgi:hypothetical protein